ncbi:ABC transporter permease [Deinococcus radiopugnans]|uniref:ABC transport system permease protein n=1 Tax=Deinococcus radiopugnans ATCC 19172 TaxID=585398 RepID=A0A5C4XMT6_9DEIO|nr:ABC transporter permease [Deinococcus radiopugnans]MBB6018773.1 putative ABC transport system permease protein [Deinococcus radiopugnans ATCC 19172]TNM64708.1 ABC transporter permease [Deinococcus radiopugnans ATCC 19172]
MFLALRELQHYRFRSVLIGGIVALIAFMVFMLTGLTRGLAQDNAALLIGSPASHFVTTGDAAGVFNRSFLSPDDVKRITAVGGDDATPLAQSFASFSDGADGTQLSGVLLGIDPTGFLAPDISGGKALTVGAKGAVVDTSLQEDGVELGDTLILKPGGETLKVLGFTKAARLNHQPVVFVTLDRWQTFNPRTRGSVSAVALQTDDAGTSQISALGGLSVLTRAQALQVLPGYKEEQGSLTMIQVFLVVVAAFVMAVFFYVLTLQKTPQFGLLKAIGASTRTLAGSLVAQMLFLTVIAVVIAGLVTLGIVALLPAGIPFALTLPTLLAASALLIVVAALSSLLSLRTVAKVDPLIAIGTVT